MCSTHYRRWRIHGTTDDPKLRERSICSVGKCGKPVRGHGLCSMHYGRLRRHGSAELGARKVPLFIECAREGCDGEVRYHPSSQQKYCSSTCYRAEKSGKYNYGQRICGHCSATYKPTGPMQKYCVACIGPTVYSKGGHSRSEGLVRLKKYGVPHSQWLEWVDRHAGLCWICREKPAAVLDHCHTTGKPRGALCQGCNSQLSGVERHGWIAKARNYLEENG